MISLEHCPVTKHAEMAHRKLRLLVYVTQVLVHCMTHIKGIG